MSKKTQLKNIFSLYLESFIKFFKRLYSLFFKNYFIYRKQIISNMAFIVGKYTY